MTRLLRWLSLVAAILVMAVAARLDDRRVAAHERWNQPSLLRRTCGSAGPFDRYFINSLIVAAMVVGRNILFCTMAGTRSRGIRSAVVSFCLLPACCRTIMLPKQVIWSRSTSRCSAWA
jgi:ABC-type glycerol-3-phosphate transport system permease component